MYIQIAGVAFWLFVIAVLVRLIVIGRGGRRVTLAQALLWIVVMASAVLLFFRPHEDIFGGQDGGAYLNFGARLSREPSLSWQDKLLSEVPRNTREQFFLYGSDRPYLSKFACGRIKDFDQSIITTWFQPAYPIVMSVPARLGSLQLILYVVPLFTLCTAFALRAVASLLIQHPASGLVAFCLYLLNPLVIWHGRAPRPEIIASFLLFAGLALLLNAWVAGHWRKWIDVVLGAVCIGLAPFFHITAWMVSLSGALLVLIVIFSGRQDFLLYPLIQATALAVFADQTLNITDTYTLRHYFVFLFDHWRICISIFLSGLVVLAGCSVAVRQWRERQPACIKVQGMGAGVAAASIVIVAYVVCFFIAVQNPPSKENPFTRYIYRTDLAAVLNMISLPIGLLGLAGLVVVAIQRNQRWKERCAVLFFGVPATLMIGNLYDFFMTRYTIVALMPMLALGLTALATLIPSEKPWQKFAILTCATGIALLGLHGRTHLVRVTEYRGLLRYLQSFAQVIEQEKGILLFEYSRLATPFDHMFGIPTLGIPHERYDDYSQIEKAWETLMRTHSNQPAFFMTPFQSPFNDRFIFKPVKVDDFTGARLVPRRWALPEISDTWGVRLQLYRTILRHDAKLDLSYDTFPFCYGMDAGNMGLRKCINVRPKPWKLKGVELDSAQSVSFRLTESAINASPRELLFFVCRNSSNGEARLNVQTSSSVVSTGLVHLANDWWFARIDGRDLKADHLVTIFSNQPLFLSDIVTIGGKGFYSLMNSIDPTKITEKTPNEFGNRWTRTDSRFCLPVPTGKEGYILMFLLAPEEVGPVVKLRLTTRDEIFQGPEVTIPTGRWLWCAWPLNDLGVQGKAQWMELQSDKPLSSPDSPDKFVALLGYLGAIQ